MKWKN